MSYDLQIFALETALRESVVRFRHVSTQGAGWLYTNDDTKVSSAINLEGACEDRGAPQFGRGSYLEYAINYLRPSFYMHEGLALVAAIAKRAEASVYDPQLNRWFEPDALDKAAMLQSYRAENSAFSASLPKPPPVMDIGASNALWNYLAQKHTLDPSLWAPDVFTFRKPRKPNRVVRAFMWLAGNGTYIPPADYVVIEGALNGIVKRGGRDLRFIPIDVWLSAVGGPTATIGRHIQALSADAAAAARDAMQPIAGLDVVSFRNVQFDQWIDADLPNERDIWR